MQPTTDKIFVSYSRHDEAFARKLAVWLSDTLNMGVWIDIDDIQPGVKWSAAIQDGLDHCEVMVVIVTPEAMESVNVEDEWQYFIDLGKPVVPILLRSAPVPYQLRRIQWIDFSDREEYNNSLRQLLVELRQHLKPLDGETPTARRQSGNKPVVKSRKEKKTRRRAQKAEDLIEQQSRALKRTNRLITILVSLLIIVGLSVGGVFAWLYFNQPDVFIIRGDTANAFAVLPGELELRTLASLNGQAPVGTRIQAGSQPITLYSEGGRIETVLQPDTIASIINLTDESLDLDLTDGNVSADTNGAQGRLTLSNGIDIAINDTIEIAIDRLTDEVTSSCFEGSCTVTDTNSGESVDLVEGESITFSNSAPNLDEAIIRRIPGEIAYVTNRHGAAEIYLMRPDGSNQTRLTNNVQITDESPTWSPTGEFIAFVSNRDNSLDIWMMSSTGEDEPINLSDNFSQDTEPAWSPDGARIAFVSNRTNGIDDIYVMNADGSDVQQITTTGGNQSPTWSPDGTMIAFSSRREGNNDIYVLNLVEPNSDAINISNHPSSDTDPAWSPDGLTIAFVSNRDNNLEIYVQDVALASASINISLSSGRDFEPTWSPNSSRVMFTSERFGNLDIVSVNAVIDPSQTDAQGVIQLTDGSSESDQQAAWLPIIRAGQ
ncbi:MAG: TIR domain-containing protein [Phototrophicaceae bacterium]